jgi:uncharacterized membrane protein
MIFVYLLAAVVALFVYAATSRLGAGARVALALVVFAVPAVSVTLWVVIRGDKAPPGAVTVNPNDKATTAEPK